MTSQERLELPESDRFISQCGVFEACSTPRLCYAAEIQKVNADQPEDASKKLFFRFVWSLLSKSDDFVDALNEHFYRHAADVQRF